MRKRKSIFFGSAILLANLTTLAYGFSHVEAPFKKATLCVRVREKNDPDTFYKPLISEKMVVNVKMIKGIGAAHEPYVCNVTVTNKQSIEWKGVVRFEVASSEAIEGRFFLPGFLYGKNRGEVDRPVGSTLYPRLRKGDINLPYSPFWMVRSDRLTHPVAIVQFDNTYYGVSGSPYFKKKSKGLVEWYPGEPGEFALFNGFGCSLENQASVYYTLGYENSPGMYDGNKISPRTALTDNCINIDPQSEITFRLYLYEFTNTDQVASVGSVIKNVYERYHEAPRQSVSARRSVGDIANAIYTDAWVPAINNYSTLVYLKDGLVDQVPMASISWTGGVEIAVPELQAALRLGNEPMRQQAISCIENIVNNSLNQKSGLPFDAFNDGQWTINGWWIRDLKGSEGHSSYLTGQCIWYILKGYEQEKKSRNLEHRNWLEFSRKVLERTIKTLNKENAFPYTWSAETGEGKDYDGFCGCWCLAALSYYIKITSNMELLATCNLVDDYYFTKFVKRMECYGTPHDTWKAVDSEGILAFIKANRILHELTNDTKYLEYLKAGLEYEFTFKFCYNVPVQVPPLSKIGWSSCGGSITSTCNPHIHPMSNNVLDDILYCYKIIRDPYLKMRMNDTWFWGLQTYNSKDNEMDFGKKGWMSERFCYSEALLIEKYPDGSPSSIWFCFLPWGASNVLEGLCGDMWDYKIE